MKFCDEEGLALIGVLRCHQVTVMTGLCLDLPWDGHGGVKLRMKGL